MARWQRKSRRGKQLFTDATRQRHRDVRLVGTIVRLQTRQTLPTCVELGRPLRTGIDRVCRPQTKDSTGSTDPGRQSSTELSTGRQGSTELSTGRQGLPTGPGNAVKVQDWCW
ncbi:hypothetical protein FB451DRAFT_1366306 [Mycena latifolia]|nr:hypothetical protein FB451DRAFT_1366306 [Mycena latifolia]